MASLLIVKIIFLVLHAEALHLTNTKSLQQLSWQSKVQVQKPDCYKIYHVSYVRVYNISHVLCWSLYVILLIFMKF